MKRWMVALAVALVLLMTVVGLAEETVELGGGLFVVGVDIEPGSYDVSIVQDFENADSVPAYKLPYVAIVLFDNMTSYTNWDPMANGQRSITVDYDQTRHVTLLDGVIMQIFDHSDAKAIFTKVK